MGGYGKRYYGALARNLTQGKDASECHAMHDKLNEDRILLAAHTDKRAGACLRQGPGCFVLNLVCA